MSCPFEVHRPGPFGFLETRSRMNVVDARHPGGVVAIVVFGSERLQAEPVTLEVRRHGELGWDERCGHPLNLGRDQVAHMCGEFR